MIKIVDINGGLLGILMTKRMECVLTADALAGENSICEYLQSIFCDNVSVSSQYVGVEYINILIADWEIANCSDCPVLTLPDVEV